MDDLISRTAAIAEIEEYIEEYSEIDPETGFHSPKWCAMNEAKDVLLKLPAVEPKRGRWYEDGIEWTLSGYECSVCGGHKITKTPFCPWCGAQMDGGETDGE